MNSRSPRTWPTLCTYSKRAEQRRQIQPFSAIVTVDREASRTPKWTSSRWVTAWTSACGKSVFSVVRRRTAKNSKAVVCTNSTWWTKTKNWFTIRITTITRIWWVRAHLSARSKSVAFLLMRLNCVSTAANGGVGPNVVPVSRPDTQGQAAYPGHQVVKPAG